ncbi:ISAs1 family transposase [Alkalinema sp. FACHB-956]|uniref:ISAs1 family transposase n=1 Tax=Alkalinema sp. FACHB-956 TaxID=2692768 RepID=UPI0016854494|nr:ISAs1 family transposase [Alkalinema sp. FACHB-956]MBD2329005.1 ISAs1 family transposase [Alkalinema sp. FACHB-956]
MPKKTVQHITEQQQHYLIGLKANQPTLYRTVQRLRKRGNCLSQAHQVDLTHNRQVQRQVSVYAAPMQLKRQWAGLECLIWVERSGVREGKPFHEQSGYISSLCLSAERFLTQIQQHWGIENRLHWVRDVLFEEDSARPGGNAPITWAILNCFVISIVRQLAYRTIPQGIRALTNQLHKVYSILTHGFSPPK